MSSLLLILFSFVYSPDCSQIDEVRSSYGNISSEKDLLSFIELLENNPCPTKEAYLASAIMQKAQFAFAPWTKYRYFLKGKKKLEGYITENPRDIDARYIRFLVQSHVPGFLGYKMNVKSDALFILNNIEEANMQETYKNQIKFHINKFLKK